MSFTSADEICCGGGEDFWGKAWLQGLKPLGGCCRYGGTEVPPFRSTPR